MEGESADVNQSALYWKRDRDARCMPDDTKTLVGPESVWKYFHPDDGDDPAEDDLDFYHSFFLPGYDDDRWQSCRPPGGAPMGFGHGHPAGISWRMPASGQRRSAYLRHRFQSDKHFEALWLRLRCDDGVIVYLDGKEVGRFAIGSDEEERHGLTTYGNLGLRYREENRVRYFKLNTRLEPGFHVMAISLHNESATSADLFIGDISLHGRSGS